MGTYIAQFTKTTKATQQHEVLQLLQPAALSPMYPIDYSSVSLPAGRIVQVDRYG